jgi:asparagine synthase (glutamine-hydrolysing)
LVEPSNPRPIEVVSADWSHGGAAAFTARAAGESEGLSSRTRVIADARIDNESALRSDLRLPGGGTAELIARAYEEWGPEFLARLSGDFAIVLWDEGRRRLLAARDPFGVRPLFYRAQPARLQVSSDVAKLIDARPDIGAIDDLRVLDFLLAAYQTREATFYRAIRELPAGHLLLADERGLQLASYWRPRAEPGVYADKEEAYREYRRLFLAAVRERLPAGAPAVIHVSGGVDSSSIAGGADVLSRSGDAREARLVGAASVHPGLATDESAYIDAVARHVSFPVERWDATRFEGPDPDLAAPSLAAPGVRAMYRSGTIGDVEIARAAGAPTILSGVGGDELGTVRGLVKDLLGRGHWRTALEGLLVFPGATFASRRARVNELLRQSLPRRLASWRRPRVEVPPWIAPRLSSRAADLLASPPLPERRFSSSVAQNVWERLTSVRFGMALTQLQQYAAAHGTTYAFPFLDRELVKFVLSFAPEHWPKPHPYARLHRDALAPFLPAEVRGRFGKAEFTPALLRRIQRSRGAVEALLEQKTWRSEAFVAPDGARKLCRDVLSGAPGVASRDVVTVWSIVTLEAWLAQVLD